MAKTDGSIAARQEVGRHEGELSAVVHNPAFRASSWKRGTQYHLLRSAWMFVKGLEHYSNFATTTR